MYSYWYSSLYSRKVEVCGVFHDCSASLTTDNVTEISNFVFVCVCVCVCMCVCVCVCVCVWSIPHVLWSTMHKYKIQTSQMKREQKELLVGSGEGMEEN
jgi:flagellar biosynthesis protein FlhB